VTTPAFSIFAVNVKEFALHIDPDSPGFGYSPENRDTITPVVKKQWTLSKDYSEEIDVPVDTTFSLFHRH